MNVEETIFIAILDVVRVIKFPFIVELYYLNGKSVHTPFWNVFYKPIFSHIRYWVVSRIRLESKMWTTKQKALIGARLSCQKAFKVDRRPNSLENPLTTVCCKVHLLINLRWHRELHFCAQYFNVSVYSACYYYTCFAGNNYFHYTRRTVTCRPFINI